MGKTCFFIGHRETDDEILPALRKAVEDHIEHKGVTEFIVGGYGGFDFRAARVVADAKQRHPGVRLTRLLPYHPSTADTPLPAHFDGSLLEYTRSREKKGLLTVTTL